MPRANPIQPGDIVYYRTRFDTVGRGIVAERMLSPLTGNPQVRVVDFASEMKDPDAGRWMDVFDDIIDAREPEADPTP